MEAHENKKGCNYCLDPDGECCFPWYGSKPAEDYEGEWIPDPDDPNGDLGTYTKCPSCGASA